MFRVTKRVPVGEDRLTDRGIEVRYRIAWEQASVAIPRCTRCAKFHEWERGDFSSTEIWLVGISLAAGGLLALFFSVGTLDGAMIMFAAFPTGFVVAQLVQLKYPPRIRSKRSHRDFPELRARLAEGWQLGEAPEGARPISMTDLADQLLEIYRSHPEGFGSTWGGPGSPQAKVREIGETLNAQGGFQLMVQAHGVFSNRCPSPGSARNLEHMWDGIGTWQG